MSKLQFVYIEFFIVGYVICNADLELLALRFVR